jgi:hypothetical protein
MTNEGEAHPQDTWNSGWVAHDEERLRRLARVPLAEKLEWLERMHRLALSLRDARRRRTRQGAR